MFSKKFSSTIKRRKRVFLSIIVTFALTLGLGYAVFGSNLNFLGSLSLHAKTLNVYVKSVSPTSGSVTPTSPAEIKGNDRKEVDFSTNLPTLTDYYEVSTVIRNGGKSKAYYIDYELKVYDSNGDEITLPSELEVTVLNTDGTSITQNTELNAASEETFKIKLNYKSGATLPATQPVYTIKVVFNYDLEPFIPTLYNIIKVEAKGGGLAAKYSGPHNDTLDNHGNKDIYYFTTPIENDETQGNQLLEKWNVKLGNTCWQMLRTTDTGGVKMIYNGEYDENNKCSDLRSDHIGLKNQYRMTLKINSLYTYGDTYSYNTTTKEFTLETPITATWSDSTADSLIGKYTCRNQTSTCTTLYEVSEYSSETSALLEAYGIVDIGYSQIGKTPMNAFGDSLNRNGYMFNKTYNNQDDGLKSGSLVGNDVEFEDGVYTLIPPSGETTLGTTLDDSNHYTCNNTNGTCNVIRYYFFGSSYYIELSGGEKIEDAVRNMLYADDVNSKNSSIKTMIDVWYKQNMISYTSQLEDVIYCNNRTSTNADINGWNKNGNIRTSFYFKEMTNKEDLNCENITDQFSVSNTKAKLLYQVGLATTTEMNLLNNKKVRATGDKYWLLTPTYHNGNSCNSVIYEDGRINSYNVDFTSFGARPVISLKPGTEYTSGTGTMDDPYVVKLD